MSDNPQNTVFNMNLSNMDNRQHLKPLFIQLLVQNYMKHKYETKRVFIYPEMINDFEIIAEELQKNNNLYYNDKMKPKLTFQVLISNIPAESYLESYEVKHGKEYYLNRFHHLKQIITKLPYPENTKLILALVPSEYNFNIELLNNPDEFDVLKTKLLSLDEETQKQIFNSIINDTSLEQKNINVALNELISNAENGLLKIYGDERNITNDVFNQLRNNLMSVEIKIITLEELESVEMTSSDIHDMLWNMM